ncbi:hypoxanthine-guanine phosphoribosyltransferase [Wielerella bovis]|uniref:hypoxanthine-guanine phosphoribosyltransferase n=1 Tax=Wielerella bovis TaxID=2917790 RepID=UPI002018816C|nr:hypoxanthine-guanine phosphoribosyltransferase [Wielerella bovis]MCG7656347.1 hypoxanthine-guanine phosphoribosyltransferase [Wielerella bovis]MCG7658572.1 hypoxanthine-guanine phosphoribosyltransferase [Wielerella bovis]ULJ60681.1 hypoxanthine-guanine phosphoribosyltransferase [Wielerella bovis]ULJ65101.1 hypoxanthine-guanine phosphoribosyltransferase [Wielerella bovis]ULJ67375.1 hypoxanthine-guanine phosphoribosyltransferase [Wielerella bovis]
MTPELQQRYEEAQQLFQNAELIHNEAKCELALQCMADDITRDLSNAYPLVLPVMGGAVVFTGKLLPLLHFPLDFDYIHITRYGDKLQGGAFEWLREPKNVAGRDVLILDDILDEGHTMHAIVEHISQMGAKSCRIAVFANKLIGKEKPIYADYVGLNVPNRYVFGYGMDAKNMWRNLGAIYAMK